MCPWLTDTLLLLFRLEAEGCDGRWEPPPWNRKKVRPGVLYADFQLPTSIF